MAVLFGASIHLQQKLFGLLRSKREFTRLRLRHVLHFLRCLDNWQLSEGDRMRLLMSCINRGTLHLFLYNLSYSIGSQSSTRPFQHYWAVYWTLHLNRTSIYKYLVKLFKNVLKRLQHIHQRDLCASFQRKEDSVQEVAAVPSVKRSVSMLASRPIKAWSQRHVVR